MDRFTVRDKIVVLRLNRLEYVPSGLYSSELIQEAGNELVAIEYGIFQKTLELEGSKIPRIRLGHPWIRYLPRLLRGLILHCAAAVRVVGLIVWQGRPRLVLAEGIHEQAIAYLLYLFLRVPYAVHVHEVYDRGELRGWNRFFFLGEKAVLRRALFTIFPEKTRGEIYAHRYDLKAPRYIAFNCPRKKGPVDPICWRSRLALPSDALLLGYWGGQGRTNALEQAIRAVARLPGVHFLLWGWSSARDRQYFEGLASGVGAGHQVLFLGELPAAKWSAIAGLDLSYCVYEPKELRLKHLATASNKMMESISVGVPVLCSSEPDFREIVEHYDFGKCTPNFTVDGIAQALKEVLRDTVGLKRRAQNAYQRHREQFHYEHQIAPMLQSFSKLVPTPSTGSPGFGRKATSNR